MSGWSMLERTPAPTLFAQIGPHSFLHTPSRRQNAAGRRLPRRLVRAAVLRGAIPQVQVPAALEDHHDASLFESAGAQFEQKFGRFLPVSARDLKAAGPNIPGQDG
jgi:hypothetical protein